jgi:hypothetical protein
MAALEIGDWIRLGLSAVGAALYLYIGFVLGKRPTSDEARLAARGFQAWWYGLGGISLVAIVFTFVSLTDLVAYLAFIYLVIIGIFVALAGLVYYLLYVYTGRRSLWKPVALVYLALTVFLVWFIHGFGGVCLYPDEATAGCQLPQNWEAGDDPTFSSFEERPEWVGTLFSVLLVLPPLLAALAYFLLFFQVKETTQKYRVAMVSVGFIFWFGTSFLSQVLGLNQSETWGYVSSSIGLVASVIILMAFKPPAWIQKRLGVQAIAQEA